MRTRTNAFYLSRIGILVKRTPLVLFFLAAISATADELPLDLSEISLQDAAHTGPEGFQDSGTLDINSVGQVVGTTFNFDYDSDTFWFYDGAATIDLGLADEDHTHPISGARKSTVIRGGLNDRGAVAGSSVLYAEDGSEAGRTPWLFDGESYQNIGLTDDAYTKTTGAVSGGAGLLNNSEQVTGWNDRFADVTDELINRTRWLYDGSEYHEIGLRGEEFIRPEYGWETNVSVTHLLEPDENGGRAFGEAYRWDEEGINGQAAWSYADGATVRIGLVDSAHTRTTDGYQSSRINTVSESGAAVGVSARFNPDGSSDYQSDWYWDGTTTHLLSGLTDALHTGADGERLSYDSAILPDGRVPGQSQQYSESGRPTFNYTHWLFDGTTYELLGIRNARHTSEEGYTETRVEAVSEDGGYIVGESERFHAGGGYSAWLYDGERTRNISRRDAPFVREDGYRYSGVGKVNNAGVVTGSSRRFDEGDGESGCGSLWLYKDGEYADMGLFDEAHTDEDGCRANSATFLSESGYVLGRSICYAESCPAFRTLWLYDGRRTIPIEIDSPDLEPLYLGEGGLAIIRVGASNNELGPWTLLAYHPDHGVLDLGLRVLEVREDFPGDGFDIYPQRAVAGGGGPGGVALRVWNGEADVQAQYQAASSAIYSLEQIATAVMDVLPEQDDNRIGLTTGSTIPLILESLSREDGDAIDFDVLDVNIASLKLGFGEAPVAQGPIYYDADGDEDLDALFGFNRAEADIYCGDTRIGLTGEAVGDLEFVASDSIRVDVCEGGCHP